MTDTEPQTPPNTVKRGPIKRTWHTIRSRWWLRWPFDLAVLATVLWAVGRYQARNLLNDETPAPAFTLADLDGNAHNLSDYAGKTVVLLFWAPWCTVCSLESDNWARLKSWRPDVEVLAIALAYEDIPAVEAFVGDDRGAYPVLLGNDAVQAAYKVDSFPTHYIIDPGGKVTYQGTGYTPTVTLWARL